MKTKVEYVNGMPVELPMLDENMETERSKLNALAMQEYLDTGTLNGEKLLEANSTFIEKAKDHNAGDTQYGEQ
ncbi:hypothetical protein LJC42_00625 [Eubacteriales bacterium OttesenSCG-928-K08]|nr:hypothetical protein [Eubacteriales bacterium OttesenSCG-928-K08]